MIITAGLARKPGMSRDDLLKTNLGIIKQVAEGVKTARARSATVIVVSNPLDAMVYTFKQVSGFPKQRVVGMAGVLDSARFRAFVAWELGVSVQDVTALVLGGHGDTMVPLRALLHRRRHPADEAPRAGQASTPSWSARRTAGGEVVALLKTGSAFVSPALSAHRDGRGDPARPEARAGLRRLPRGRVRRQGPLRRRARACSARAASSA